jgi:hypothetical protein
VAITASPSENFVHALDRASAARMLKLIFAQKRIELDSSRKDLDEYRDFLRKDYEVTDYIIHKAAERLFAMIVANNDRVSHRNDVLRDLMRRPELLRLERRIDPCLSICEKIRESAKQLADLARRLKSGFSHKKFVNPASLPTRGEIDGRLEEIMDGLKALDGEIAALLELSDI